MYLKVWMVVAVIETSFPWGKVSVTSYSQASSCWCCCRYQLRTSSKLSLIHRQQHVTVQCSLKWKFFVKIKDRDWLPSDQNLNFIQTFMPLCYCKYDCNVQHLTFTIQHRMTNQLLSINLNHIDTDLMAVSAFYYKFATWAQKSDLNTTFSRTPHI